MKKEAKNLISWSLGAVLLVGVIALIVNGGNGGDNSNTTAYSASALTAVEDSFDFDTISMKDGDVSHTFEITNNGEEPVKIEKVYTSCMCTTAYITDAYGKKHGKFGMPGHNLPSRTNIEIAPGGRASVEAIFNPKAHGPSGVGLAERSIYLETNSAKYPKVELKFRALVIR